MAFRTAFYHLSFIHCHLITFTPSSPRRHLPLPCRLPCRPCYSWVSPWQRSGWRVRLLRQCRGGSQAGGDFYAVNIGEGSQAELVFDMPVWVHYPVVSDEYLYYSIDESVICRIRLGVPGAEEERLGVPNAEGTRLILPDAEQPCCIVQDAYSSMKFYQYILR